MRPWGPWKKVVPFIFFPARCFSVEESKGGNIERRSNELHTLIERKYISSIFDLDYDINGLQYQYIPSLFEIHAVRGASTGQLYIILIV